jgi:hypothetical protein
LSIFKGLRIDEGTFAFCAAANDPADENASGHAPDAPSYIRKLLKRQRFCLRPRTLLECGQIVAAESGRRRHEERPKDGRTDATPATQADATGPKNRERCETEQGDNSRVSGTEISKNVLFRAPSEKAEGASPSRAGRAAGST